MSIYNYHRDAPCASKSIRVGTAHRSMDPESFACDIFYRLSYFCAAPQNRTRLGFPDIRLEILTLSGQRDIKVTSWAFAARTSVASSRSLAHSSEAEAELL